MKKNNLLYIIVVFALLLLVQNLLILRSVRNMSGDAHVVNYSGLVRGATQRLVKLELSYHPNDELMARLEEYLFGLAGRENDYQIVYMAYEPFQESIKDLIVIWQELKSSIYDYRQGFISGETLLDVSERHFAKADEATHNAEYGSEGEVTSTEIIIIAGMAAITVIVVIVAIFMYILRRQERMQMELLREKNLQLESAIFEANEAMQDYMLFYTKGNAAVKKLYFGKQSNVADCEQSNEEILVGKTKKTSIHQLILNKIKMLLLGLLCFILAIIISTIDDYGKMYGFTQATREVMVFIEETG